MATRTKGKKVPTSTGEKEFRTALKRIDASLSRISKRNKKMAPKLRKLRKITDG